MTITWRPALLVIAAGVLGYLYARGAENRGHALRPGSTVPQLALEDLAGQPASLETLRGRVVVLNFWATWCPPCVEEMPSLERLQRALGAEGLSVVAVSTDEDRDALRAFVMRRQLTLPVWLDPGGRLAAEAYRATGYPETFVIDRDGLLVEHVIGPVEWDSPERTAALRGLLRGSGR